MMDERDVPLLERHVEPPPPASPSSGAQDGCDVEWWQRRKARSPGLRRGVAAASLVWTLLKLGWALYVSLTVSAYYAKLERMETQTAALQALVNSVGAQATAAVQQTAALQGTVQLVDAQGAGRVLGVVTRVFPRANDPAPPSE